RRVGVDQEQARTSPEGALAHPDSSEDCREVPVALRERASTWRGARPLLALFDQVLVSGTKFAATVLGGRYCGATELAGYALACSVLVLMSNIQFSLISAPFTFFSHHISLRQRAALAGSALVQQGVITVAAIPTALCLAGLLRLHASTASAAG